MRDSAYAGMTVMGAQAVMGVGSRFRGNDVGGGFMETRLAPRLRRWGAEWIPAYAGMTVMVSGMTDKGRKLTVMGTRGWRVGP